jgi:hypothetical protein
MMLFWTDDQYRYLRDVPIRIEAALAEQGKESPAPKGFGMLLAIIMNAGMKCVMWGLVLNTIFRATLPTPSA